MNRQTKIYLLAGAVLGIIGGLCSKGLTQFEADYLYRHGFQVRDAILIGSVTPVVLFTGLYFLIVALCRAIIK